MDLPEQLPNHVRVKGITEIVPKDAVIDIHMTLMSLMNQGILEGLALGELVLSSYGYERSVTDPRLIEILQNTRLTDGTDETGRLAVDAITKQIIVASTSLEGYNVIIRPLSEIIEAP